ncbi:PQQ-dependent sugar dehydrogenase [Streptomyces abyssomicinicus]|uniref:PQQ-dependent sugar dehydrogenase n=1 Tax=Streptomyces abyssomicinicus TaxID=574929 RepID=UPI00125040A6|nr:PQQ-dependent sugar dehydrogenase [Streptomyces abyssomicinicus]
MSLRRLRRHRWIGLLLALPLAVAGPLSLPASSAEAPPAKELQTAKELQAGAAALPALEEVAATTTQVAYGLRRPTALVAPDDGTGRLFITEKSGRVRVYHPDTGLSSTPLLDIVDKVDESGNERGLLGIALAPDFARSKQLYLAYTALPDAAVTLARYHLTDSRLEVLLQQPHAEYSNHNGGQLAFGPDGKLYWAIGDGGGSGDPFDTGQRKDTLLGKILRLDVSRSCGALAYCIPPDNPFVGVDGARGEIWLWGTRNPWRFSFDHADGSMWVADVGQGRWEEITHLARGEQAGANLGWSCYEGPQVFDEAQCASGARYTPQDFYYSPYNGNCAVIGGHVYRGRQYADLVGGTYIATDYCSSQVWALRPDGNGGFRQADIGDMPTQVTAVGTTPEGEFYVVNDLPGGLHKVSFERTKPICKVDVKKTAWGNGMTVDLTVTNTGTTPIDGWSLQFALPYGQTVTSDWNTDMTNLGDIYTAPDADHNASIPPGGSVTLGYLVTHTGDAATPGRFRLNETACARTGS